MNRKIQSLISIMVFAGLFVGGCAKAATPVPTATPTTTPTSTLTPSPAPTIQPGDSKRTLMVDDLDRSYSLHVPQGLAADKPLPLVMAFDEGPGVYMEPITGFNDLADAHGFLILYPIGLESPIGDFSWNIGGGIYGYSGKNNINEEDYIRGVLSDLGAIARIDSKRIYAAGFGPGAMFVYHLGCEMSDMFAAIASVAGNLLDFPCQPQQPVSVIHEHGLNDIYVPYAGGLGWEGITFPSVEQSVATWAQLDGCNSVPQVEKQGKVTHSVYSSCRAGTAVELFALEGWGAAWPEPDVYPTFSTPMIWDFFAAHPKQ